MNARIGSDLTVYGDATDWNIINRRHIKIPFNLLLCWSLVIETKKEGPRARVSPVHIWRETG